MLHGLLWLPLLLIFVLLTALGWLERRRQNLFRNWANGSEICKLDSSGAAFLKDGELIENALNSVITKRSSTIINSANNRNTEPTEENCPVEIKGQISELRDLLGKLHNQKVWYRPKNRFAYIGG